MVLLCGLDPVTPATCTEGSRSEQFLALLGTVSPTQPVFHNLEDGNLRLQLMDGSVMYFSPVV